MTYLQDGLSIFFVSAGIFFMVVGSIGIIKFPDFYSRTHATSKVDTLGIVLFLGGLSIHLGISQNSAKLMMAIMFIIIANPVASHALARAAY
ncbi:MAG: monovalent cation/H(+) antiporter subunit G [Bacteriovoracaceae bacterium]